MKTNIYSVEILCSL